MTRSQPARAVAGLIVTLLVLHFVSDRIAALLALMAAWWLFFRPIAAVERVMFVFASLFFLVQNYVALKEGLFAFRDRDLLLMPWYEPALWGFYFLALKRFTGNGDRQRPGLTWQSVAAVVVTSLMFSLFSHDSRLLLVATSASTTLLFALFHTPADIRFALSALGLGLVIELFGVSTGLWWYPAPDFLGIPYWFATMWLSVGLLGRRFLIPASEWLACSLRVHSGRAR